MAEHLGWAIGDGESVRIWDDAWLSTECIQRPMGPATEASKDMMVKALFQEGTQKWDEEKVERLLPELGESIMSIKTSRQGGPDRRIWLRNPAGEYTAKTGYVAALERRASNPTTQRERGINSRWIEDIWKLNIPPKMKLLLWKASHNALPVSERLAARQIIPNPKCINCEEAETVIHMVFLCPSAREVWRKFPSKVELNLDNVTNFAEGWRRVKRIICLPPTGVLSENLAVWTVWSIWLARNQRIFREEKTCPLEVMNRAVRLAREWHQAQPVAEQGVKRIRSEWEGPMNEIICRSDAAWSREGHQAGVAWEFVGIGKEHLCSGSQTFANVKSPLVAEGLAVLAAMETAISLDFKQISFESDSSKLMTAIKDGSNVSDLHGILSDINSLSLAFVSVSFYWVSRSSVSNVDGIAKQVLRNLVMNPV
ncbi:hypothetical protein Bca52824_005133 [Brassica carinata]|uniref:Reverse transcriptase zinc-binding domain-containing protein n=1 Tax=Brassica carinata TaxID=52824 RepID=A0A8X8BGQ0_BRACI|nr:hypothetical protein Bca52824_005133 [Brassica carinata]